MAQAQETTIGPRTRLRARVHGDGDLALEGQLEGNVALGGKLTVHEGQAHGNVLGSSVYLCTSFPGSRNLVLGA